MSPFCSGTLAAARREIDRMLSEIEKACKTPTPEAWKHIALAHVHAIRAKAQVNAALEIEALAEKENAA